MIDALRHGGGARLVPAPGEDLCLVFADTRYWRPSDQPTETLQRFADVVAWCETAKSLDWTTAGELAEWAARHESKAAGLFDDLLAARETIYRLFSATAAGQTPAPADVAALNHLLERAPGRTDAVMTRTGNRWRLPPARPTVASLLAPVLWSAGDLFVGGRLARVRLCANEKCRWLFLDDSKSGTRRWCAMSACGNRAKAHRHYLRRLKAEGAI